MLLGAFKEHMRSYPQTSQISFCNFEQAKNCN